MGQTSGRVCIFDEHVSTGSVYSEAGFYDFLGAFDLYTLQAVVSASTAAGTVTAQLEVSSDGRNWINKNSSAEIAGATLSTTQQTAASGVDAGGANGGRQALGRIRVSLSAGYARVRIYAVGRTA